MTSAKKNVLILGASYGSLVGTKLLMAGHDATLVCTGPTAALIEREGTLVRMPVRGREAPLEIRSTDLEGKLSATTPEAADLPRYDLVFLGMQEPQYGAPGVRELMRRVAAANIPCVAIMNIPPPPYLERLPRLDASALKDCYTDPSVWEGFDPKRVTLASPDPQAFRPPGEGKNVLQVGLPTNFKTARFVEEDSTAMLRALQADIEAVRFDPGDGALEVPVKLKVHESVFVPLAKWPMLVTGNYRCIGRDEMISIRDAVHKDATASREVYAWVSDLCIGLGAEPGDLVPFEKYAKAAEGLKKPSSAARALFGGATHIERVDCLIRRVAAQADQQSQVLDEVVACVDQRLAMNRQAS